MATKALTGAYPNGYTLAPRYSALHIKDTASIGGAGVTAKSLAGINNHGVIAAGVYQGLAGAYSGIKLAAGYVNNLGSITGGASNPSTPGQTGGYGVAVKYGNVTNSGAITGGAGGAESSGGAGVSVYIGSLSNTAGTISGGAGGVAGGAGLVSFGYAQLTNSAVIRGGSSSAGAGGYGAEFRGGANVVNTGKIYGGAGSGSSRGGTGAYLLDSGGIFNSGIISGGTGSVSSSGDNTGGVVLAQSGTVNNLGSILGAGAGGYGVSLLAGGALTNGGSSDADALVSGYGGVFSGARGPAVVTNYGTIQGTGGTSVTFASSADRLIAEAGSEFVGAVEGGGGTLELAGGAGTITGLGGAGTLSGAVTAAFSGFGAYVLDQGSTWTANGTNLVSPGQSLTVAGSLVVDAGTFTVGGYLHVGKTGSIGGQGLAGGVGSNIVNDGAITTATGAGLHLAGSATLVNGEAGNASANITGATGVKVSGAGAATITNFGVIDGTAGTSVKLSAPGDTLVAEAGSNFIGAVKGGGGTLELGGGTGAINVLAGSGTLAGAVSANFSGFDAFVIDAGGLWTLDGTDSLSAGQTISVAGILTAVDATIADGGTITAVDGGVVKLKGADIQGGILDSVGTGEFKTGQGANVLDGTSSTVTIAGSVRVAQSTSLTLQGAIDNSGAIIASAGATLTASGALDNSGSVDLTGGASGRTEMFVGASGLTLTGGGTVQFNGAFLGANTAATLTNVDNTIVGSSSSLSGGYLGAGPLTIVNEAAGVIEATGPFGLVLATNVTNSGLIELTGITEPGGGLVIVGATIDDSSGGTVLAAGSTVFVSSGGEFIGGTLSSSDGGAIEVLDVAGLDGGATQLTNAGTIDVPDNKILTLQGVIDNTGQIDLDGSAIMGLQPTGATLTGGGTVNLGGGATIVGETGVAFDNTGDTIIGGGDVGAGQLAVTNGAAGTIDATGAMTLDFGAATITNGGLIEATGSGILTIASPVDNTGQLAVAGGSLDAEDAVTGAGSATIDGGTLTFGASFGGNVDFAGTTGVLVLAQSQSYGGDISGFSLTGGTSLDLKDIAFVSTDEANFSGTASGGVLTVSDGTHIARINLVGDYLSSVFAASSDGLGGTIIVDPTTGRGAQRFAADMAGLGGAAAAPHWVSDPRFTAAAVLTAISRHPLA